MRTYDVTLTITPDMPVWPGDTPPTLIRIDSLSKGDEANTSQVTMSVHTGTHVDAPDHFLGNGKTVDQMPLEALLGRAYVLYLPEIEHITARALEVSDIPPRTRRLLFKTRNSDYWARGVKTFQKDFAALTPDAAQYLVDRNVRLVGVDYLSVAPFSQSTPSHRILLEAGVVVLEGLDLSQVSQGRYTLTCLPLKLGGSDGAPARVILMGV
jgi:arylformamidase